MPHQFFGSRSGSTSKSNHKGKCPEGKTRDRESKRCREKKKTGASGPRGPYKPRGPLTKARSPCPEGKTRDRETKRCRAKYQTGVLPRTPCSPGKVRDTDSKRCRSPRKPGPRKHSASRSSQRSRGTPSSYYEGAYDNMFAGDYGSPIDYGSY
jgi:hypothetical protein